MPDLAAAALRLDAWLDTMRGPYGYGGPVAHWWQQSFLYTGVGRDWRYEGIVCGYLQLWQRTGQTRWLAKARRAGDDLLGGQLPSGHFAASAFEINPATAGTPHEAACDVALLTLANALWQTDRAAAERYLSCAELNLRRFYEGSLWDDETRSFRDDPGYPSFVPNKAATACEALFLLSALSGEARWVERYALPTLQRVLAHQVRDGGRLDGAIAQNSFGQRVIAKYFPLYIARCVPALLRAWRWAGEEPYADAALRAMRFIARWVDRAGNLPIVIYANGQCIRRPSWVAGLGDLLRVADEAAEVSFPGGALDTLVPRLLDGQDASGGIQTAHGFAEQALGRRGKLPDVRDILHVVGWCDKAFRYLAGHALPDGAAVPTPTTVFSSPCRLLGQELHLVETAAVVEITERGDLCYRWRKGEPWPDIAAPAFWLR